jgi:glycosyltransferase involved in cell wall biosynthesis
VKEFESTFTIIIPTLGRPGLWDTLDQIESVKAVTEVIVVFEMGYFNKSDLMKRALSYTKVQFIEGSRPGISANLNDGLSLLNTNYFGFFSDDDLWIPVDFETEMRLLESGDVDLLFGASKMERFSSKNSVRPKIAIVRPSQILERPWWLPSPYYLSLNNVIASSNVKNHLFKENLNGYEDIEWLLRLEASGFRYKQNFTLRSSITVDDIRNSKRDDVNLRRNVFNHLKVLNKTWAEKYITNISPRNHILALNIIEIMRIAKERRIYLDRTFFLKDLIVGLLQVIYSVSLRLAVTSLKRVRRFF